MWTATFLINAWLPFLCGRGRGCPCLLDPDEPATRGGGRRTCPRLRHVVITSVTRADDLEDGGASHFVATVRAVRAAVPVWRIEVLTSDFAGRCSVDAVAAARPDVYNHNLETVPRLGARPERSTSDPLRVLRRVRETRPDLPTNLAFFLVLDRRGGHVMRSQIRSPTGYRC